ncbi:transcription initiation factor TFIID subunit 8-like [Chironomus tepperi]|uniref:transcription initiation factor TFIID subunit 8-like n=1 Tax=Chironomus tepperi TaxID=113505 RepID=UPI00391F3F8A
MSDPRRKVMKEAVCLLVSEAGFTSATDESLETLTEMLIGLMTEMATQTRNYAELAGRTQSVVGDVVMGLISMGLSYKDLDKYAFRENRPIARGLNTNQPQKPLQILQAGTKPSYPVHIPSHLPALPDPHAYIRTPTYKQPETEYEAIREKSANQKRDIEKALTKFLAKTAKETHNLFDNEEVQVYPLIASKPTTVPAYITALNPSDQIFDFEELEYYYQVANRKPDNDEMESEVEEKREDEESQSPPKKRKNKKSSDLKKETDSVATTRPPTPVEVKPLPPPPEPQEKVIDNPFLKLKKSTA